MATWGVGGRHSSRPLGCCPWLSARNRSCCCEWHAGGTAGEGDPGTACRRWLGRDRRVRPVLGDHCSVGQAVGDGAVARPIQASSRTAGFLSVTCDPGTAHANLYIHRRCSSRGSRRSRIRASLQETVAAAGGDASPDLPAGRDFRMGEGFPAVTFVSRQAGNPSRHISRGRIVRGKAACPESVPQDGWRAMRRLG
jgi:hypothetical protein